VSAFIVDASVAAKWFLAEPLAEQALRWLTGSHELHAPDIMLLELNHLFVKRVRRAHLTSEEATQARVVLSRLAIRYHPLHVVLDPACDLANRTGCSLYDALYLALALLLEERMVTADRRFFNSVSRGQWGEHVIWVEDAPPG
jgi:predicted nucleic acid-binding protein